MKKITTTGIIKAAAAWVLLVLCAPNGPDDQAGGGVSNPNVPSAFAITGKVDFTHAPGAVPESTTVQLFKIVEEVDTLVYNVPVMHYDWWPVDTVLADAEGRFAFATPENGYYSVYAENADQKAFGGYWAYDTADTLLEVDDLNMDDPVNVQVKVTVVDTSFHYLRLYVAPVGMPFQYYIVSPGETIQMQDIPRSDFKLEVRTYDGTGVGGPKTWDYTSMTTGPPADDSIFTINYSGLPDVNEG